MYQQLIAFLAGGLLLASSAACGGDNDPCASLVDHQLRLIQQDSAFDQTQKKALAEELVDAKPRIAALCRESLAEDGDVAYRALQCSLDARSLSAMHACETPPTFAAGIASARLRLGRPREKAAFPDDIPPPPTRFEATSTPPLPTARTGAAMAAPVEPPAPE